MFSSDYSDFNKSPPQPATDPLKSHTNGKKGNNLEFLQEKIKEANQPSLSLHNKIHLLKDLEVKILQTHSTDAISEVRNALAQLLSEQYELCKGMSEEDKMQLYTSIPEDAMKEVMHIGKVLEISDMNPSEKVRILLGIQKLGIPKITSPAMKGVILMAIIRIPQTEKADVVDWTLRLFTEKMNGNEINIIINSLAQVPQADRADVIDWALKLVTEKMRGYKKAQIINEVAQVPQADRADVVGWTLKLSTKKMGGNEKAAIINALTKVPQTERADVVSWAIFTETMSGFKKDKFLTILVQVPQAERADIVNWSLKLLTATMYLSEGHNIINSLLRIPQKERADVVSWAVFTETMSGFKKADSITILAQIPTEERADVVSWFLKLFNSKMNFYTGQCIVDTLIQVPQAERADVVDWAQKLFTETMSGSEPYIIKTLIQVPPPERADVVDWALKLTTQQMKGIDKSAYLEKVLVQIPQELREDIADCALTLFTKTMSGFERALIVRALFKIFQEERIDVIGMVVNHLPKTISGFEKAALIADYLQVLHVEMTPRLFTETMSNISYERSLIVGALAQIPQAEREDIIGYTLLLFTQKGASPYDILEAVQFIKDIPLSQQKTLFEDSLNLCDELMTWSEKITVLYVMQNTSYQQEDLKQAEKYFTPDMSWREKLNLFLCSVYHLNLDEILYPVTETEEDFEDLVEGDLDHILEDFFTPLPSNSIFADTDLVICKEDFQHALPLNGIKLSELKEIEALALQIFSGNGKIRIDSSYKPFEMQVQGYIKKLLTRPIGRKLIKKVMESQNLNTLTITSGQTSCFNRSDSLIYLSENENLTNPGQKSYMQPPFIVLGHELIHASHPDSSSQMPPTLDPDYDNLEEQITIAGFKKNIELPESLELKPGFEKNMEWLKSLNLEEGWEEEPIFTEENFDPINERNLHAAFANSKELFYPRLSHKGYAREHILEDPSVARLFAKARITNHLTQSKLKAPLNLQKVYDKLISDI